MELWKGIVRKFMEIITFIMGIMGIHDQQGDTPSTWVCLNMEDATLSGYFHYFFLNRTINYGQPLFWLFISRIFADKLTSHIT